VGRTNADAWKTVAFYTEKLTGHAQKLGFAGVAICWFFRSSNGTFPDLILGGLTAFVIYFLLDGSQYWWAARTHRNWIQAQEQKNRENKRPFDEGDFAFPVELDRPAWDLFNIKLGVLVLAFVLVGVELVRQM